MYVGAPEKEISESPMYQEGTNLATHPLLATETGAPLPGTPPRAIAIGRLLLPQDIRPRAPAAPEHLPQGILLFRVEVPPPSPGIQLPNAETPQSVGTNHLDAETVLPPDAGVPLPDIGAAPLYIGAHLLEAVALLLDTGLPLPGAEALHPEEGVQKLRFYLTGEGARAQL